jgi:hypothetical protein
VNLSPDAIPGAPLQQVPIMSREKEMLAVQLHYTCRSCQRQVMEPVRQPLSGEEADAFPFLCPWCTPAEKAGASTENTIPT